MTTVEDLLAGHDALGLRHVAADRAAERGFHALGVQDGHRLGVGLTHHVVGAVSGLGIGVSRPDPQSQSRHAGS